MYVSLTQFSCFLLVAGTEYSKEKEMYIRLEEHLNGGFFKKLCFSLMCPRLSFLTAIKKIHIITSVDNKNRYVIQNKPTPEKCTWIEPLAVLPNMHRKGIATKLLEHCKRRTLQLKMSGMKLLVKPINAPARCLYEKIGFICTGHYTYTDIYTLILKEYH